MKVSEQKALTKFLNDTVAELYISGRSYSSIASEMTERGYKMGASAVSGRLSRLVKKGIIKYREPVEPKEKHKPHGKVKVFTCPQFRNYTSAPMEEWNYPSNEKSVTLMNLTNRACRFPCSDGLFCGQDKQGKSSYCEHHHAIVFQPRRKNDRTGNSLV